MLKIADQYITEDGVDYEAIAKCKAFRRYMDDCLELQQVTIHLKSIARSRPLIHSSLALTGGVRRIGKE